MLQRYIAGMSVMAAQLGPLLEEVKTELRTAGFTVVPSPSNIYDSHIRLTDYTRHVRFLNGISGWGKDHY